MPFLFTFPTKEFSMKNKICCYVLKFPTKHLVNRKRHSHTCIKLHRNVIQNGTACGMVII